MFICAKETECSSSSNSTKLRYHITELNPTGHEPDNLTGVLLPTPGVTVTSQYLMIRTTFNYKYLFCVNFSGLSSADFRLDGVI